MSDTNPTVVLVHGAFAESSSWNGVIRALTQPGLAVVAAANPLRSLSGDAAYVRDVVASIGGPVVLVGHSYGGMSSPRRPPTMRPSWASSTSRHSCPGRGRVP